MLLLLLLLLLLRLTTAAHWRNKLIRLPLPYGLVMEAWKARAGASLESTLSHAAVTCTRGGGWVLVEGGVLVEGMRVLVVEGARRGVEGQVTLVGTRSHLLSRKTRCLCFASFLRKASACGQRVPIGSRASSTSTSTSDESITW